MFRRSCLAVGACLLGLASPASALTVYVNAANAAAGSGTSSSPYQSLQSALNAARANSAINYIFVAGGTYLPGSASTDTFLMVPGVYVMCGYNSAWTVRDPAANPVILDGYLAAGVRAKHVVTCDGGMYLDGVSIINGNASLSLGGGVYIKSGWGRLANSTVEDNWAYSGGGVGVEPQGRLWLYNVIVRDNLATYGGGLNCSSSDANAMNRVSFTGNSASYGGGIWATGNLEAESVLLSRNTASVYGGAVYTMATSTSSINFTNATIADNSAGNQAGGIYAGTVTTGGVGLYNSIVWNNAAPLYAQGRGDVGAMLSDIQGEATVSFNYTLWCIDADPKFLSATDYRLKSSSPCLEAGLDSYVDYSYDLLGNARIARSSLMPPSDLRVDMGAYERQGTLLPVVP